MLWLILLLTLTFILRLIIVVQIDALILMVIFYIGIVDVVFVDIDAAPWLQKQSVSTFFGTHCWSRFRGSKYLVWLVITVDVDTDIDLRDC